MLSAVRVKKAPRYRSLDALTYVLEEPLPDGPFGHAPMPVSDVLAIGASPKPPLAWIVVYHGPPIPDLKPMNSGWCMPA
jgi:hypothetical protein